MTRAARIAALIVGLAGIVVALAAALRELVLASEEDISWQTSQAVRDLTGDPGWATWVVAAVAAALAVALIVLAVRQFRASDGGPAFIQFEDEHGWARLNVRAIERGMSRRLQAEIPGVRVRDLELDKTGDVWRVIVGADVPIRDVQALRARMHSILSDDLQSTGGMRLQRLDLVVRTLIR